MMMAEKEKYTIRAPFDGIICMAYAVAEGSEVGGGQICCAISEESKTEVYLDQKLGFPFRAEVTDTH